MSVVVDIIEDLGDAVGDFIGDAVDFVGDVVEGALDDPIGTIATIAAVATGNAWAVPLINGANVAIQGGDLGDIVKSVAISYAAQGIGQQVGKAVGTAVGSELGSTAATYGTQYGSQQTAMLMAQEIGLQTAQEIAANIVTDFAASGAAAAAVAVITDRDPVQAFLTGGAAGATPAVLGQIDGFTDLPITAQKVIERGVSAGLSGGDITSAAVGAMLTSSQITTDLLSSVDSEYFDDKTKDIVASVLMQTATAAFAGGDPSTAFKNALMHAGSKELGNMLTHEFKMLTDDTYAAAYDMQETAKALENVSGDFESTKEKYNSVVSNLQTRQANAEKLRDVADNAWDAYQADKTEAKYNAYVSAANAANDYTTQLNTDYYNTYESQLATYEEQLNNYVADYERLQVEFQDRQDLFEDTSDRLSQAMPELRDYANQFFVSEMDPDFDAEAYARLNGLGEEVDPYAHWLEVGQFQGLPTNNQNAEFYLGAARGDLVSNILESRGLSLATASPDIISGLYAQVEATYGDNLTATKYDRGGLGDRLGGGLGTAREDLVDAILGAKGLSVADADPELVQQLYENIEATYGNDIQATQSDANGLYGRLSGTGDAYMPPVQITGEVAINRPILGSSSQELQDSYSMPSGWRFATQAEVLNNTAQFHADKNGLVSYLMPSDTEPSNMWVPGAGANQPLSILITSPDDSGGAAFADYVYQSPTFDELADIDPEAYLVTLSTIPETVATGTEFGVSQYLIRLAQAAVKGAEASGNDTLINTTANIIRATGGISQAFGATIGLLSGDAPTDSKLYKFGDALAQLGEASNTQEYKDRIAFIKESIGEAEGFWETTEAIFDQAIQDPAVFAAEFIGVEATQELIPLAIGGLAGAGVKGVALARGVATDIAETMGRRAAISGALASDVAESVGATAEETYNTSYQIGLEQGLSEADAEAWALRNAQKSAVVAGIVTMAAGGLGNAALEKAIFGSRAVTSGMDEALNAIIDTVKNSTKIAIKEGVSEYGEEAIIAASQEAMYSVLDPDRDVTGSIATAGTLGMIASGSISGGVSLADGMGATTGDMVRNMILSSSGVENIRQTTTSVEEAHAALEGLGIAGDPYITAAIFHDVAPDEYASVGQINADITKAIETETGSDVGAYTFDADDFANFVGVQTPDLGSTIQEYIDSRYTTFNEARDYLQGQGYTNPTAAEVNQFVTQGTESDTERLIREFADPLVTDYNEARQMMLDLGYTDPRDAEINRFVGKYAETVSKDKVNAYVDPRQVTEAEARQYFADLGYTPTNDELAQFVRHGWTVNQDRVETELGEYVDPRYVDIDEVREAYEALGLSRPTQADLEKFVGQYEESELAGKAEEYLPTGRYNSIVELIDNLAAEQGTSPEILEALGTVKDDLQKQIEDLGFVIDEATGTVLSEMQATENRLTDLIEANEAAGMSRDEAIQSAVDALANDLGTTREDILGQLEQNRSELLNEIEGLGTQISDLEATLLDQIATNEAAGMSRDEALNAAIETLATDLGTTRDDLLDQLGTTESNLLEEMSALEERVGEQVSEVEQTLLNQIAANEAAGMERDEAIQAAINDVAIDLGTTKEALLDQIGTTEQALIDRITASETALGEQIGTVEQSLLDQMSVYEEAGIERDVALGMAIDSVSEELGITRDALLDQIGLTEENLLTRLGETEAALETRISETEATLSTEIQNVADILGKPYTDVTQADIDFVNDLITQQTAQPDMALTTEQLAYDVTGDGVINQADLDILQTQYGLTQGTIDPTTQTDFVFDPAMDTVWGKPTGVFSNLDAIQKQAEADRREQAYRDFLMMGGLQDQKVTVTTPQEGAKIGPAYDWSSIFATPQQAQFYSGFSPYGAYAEGGTVEDLLKLLEDK